MPKAPDANDRHRGLGPPLPDDPEDGAEVMEDPEVVRKNKEEQAKAAELVARLEQRRVGAFLDEALRRMDARANNIEIPIPLPWEKLASMLGGGLWPGLYVLVGNTGSGKTQFALQIALHAARSQTPTLYIGLELGQLDLTARLLGLITDANWSELYLGQSVAMDKLKREQAVAELRGLPLHLAFGGPMGWSYTELAGEAEAIRKVYPEEQGPGSRPMLIVLDFLQLVGSPLDSREELRERIGKASYAARAVARDLNAAVLLVSSTARENYGRLNAEKDGEKPFGQGDAWKYVGLGKESGEIEYACDALMVLGRSGDAISNGTPCSVAVSKVRAGSPGWVSLTFNGSSFRGPESAPPKRKIQG